MLATIYKQNPRVVTLLLKADAKACPQKTLPQLMRQSCLANIYVYVYIGIYLSPGAFFPEGRAQ